MLDAERERVATRADRLSALTPGRTGNLSLRRGDHLAITPSGVAYDRVEPADVPVLALTGERVAGSREPSSEAALHLAVYEAFGAGAVVHAHPPWATALAVLGEPVRPVHYGLARAGGRVPVADYATFGTEALAENAVAAMAEVEASACLLANHGLVAYGGDARAAFETAEAVESVARLDYLARALGAGERVVLSEVQVETAAARFEAYGGSHGEGE